MNFPLGCRVRLDPCSIDDIPADMLGAINPRDVGIVESIGDSIGFHDSVGVRFGSIVYECDPDWLIVV